MANPNPNPPPVEYRFKKGQGGRPKGSRNKLSESFFDALTADFQKNGEAAIVAARAESPLGYLKVVASVIPQKVEVEKVAAAVTDDELLQIIRGGSASPSVEPQPNVESFGTA